MNSTLKSKENLDVDFLTVRRARVAVEFNEPQFEGVIQDADEIKMITVNQQALAINGEPDRTRSRLKSWPDLLHVTNRLRAY